MICQQCQEQPAQVQYTEVVGGAKRMEWLCPACARERGIHLQVEASPVEPEDVLPGVTESLGGDPELECPECGLDLESFRQSGRVGCAHCYETFGDALESLLRRVHHATEHAPREGGQDAQSRLRRVLDTLRRELHESVRREEFERAAALRDEIRRYEEEATAMDAGGTAREDAEAEEGRS